MIGAKFGVILNVLGFINAALLNTFLLIFIEFIMCLFERNKYKLLMYSEAELAG